MGLVLSMCKQRKRNSIHDMVSKTPAETKISAITKPAIPSTEITQCSAITREPIKTYGFPYPYYIPYHQQMLNFSHFPRVSTPVCVPFNETYAINNEYSSNPYVAQAYNCREAFIIPSTLSTVQSRETSISDNTSTEHSDEYRTITHVKSEQLFETNHDDQTRLIKKSASTPIDMFLIDISNEHVLVGQPVSMNIRHLLLDTLQNHYASSSTPIRIEPSSVATYAHENLLNYIPHVCERYPNLTIRSDQQTKNTLHIRLPSEFSRSLNNST
ncbi:unnamed protein product [Adineta ricciae]|uniref:Uncharacterized protein n=1 Tax=Adineta ricciae TaxID=249248 RepID=A0A814BLF0_ADIRI|nr:unnamed protein product [Adineta ricciae]CAF1521016.1 unnamed protein product [Adineta ricciae]